MTWKSVMTEYCFINPDPTVQFSIRHYPESNTYTIRRVEWESDDDDADIKTDDEFDIPPAVLKEMAKAVDTLGDTPDVEEIPF